MGDRTTVTLTVLESQANQAETVFEFSYNSDYNVSNDLHCFEFCDINYGDLPFLDALQNQGIAFSSDWGGGDEYGPGSETCRFTESGEAIRKSISDEYRNPPINKLLKLIDQPDALRAFILNHHEEISVANWDNQEKYGKLYLTKQLINPT